MSNTGADTNGRIVSITEKGQATIPKEFREKHGISTPGKVKFVESEDGEILVRPVGSMREFRGLERSGDEERPATDVLRESREDDLEDADELVNEFSEKADEK
ncbi:AbrB/MazE/SpoVT family DNA-binding domain-containing protein [Natrialbaceae archaeon A-CW3]